MKCLDSARQSLIEGFRSERESLSPCGKGDEEDRLGKVPASQNTLDNSLAVPKATSLLEQTSQAFTQIADKAMPATVYIKAEITQPERQESSTPFDMFNDEFFRHFFGG